MAINIPDLIVSIILNVAIPYVLYSLSKRYISPSEVTALTIALAIPILDSVINFIRHRSIDLFALLTFLAILAGLIKIFIGFDIGQLLSQELFLTATLSAVCFLSFLLPHPLMFYISRQIIAGRDRDKIISYNYRWKYPYNRLVNRLVTVVWGFAFAGDFIVHFIIVNYFADSTVQQISPYIFWGIISVTFLWTIYFLLYASKQAQETIM